MQIHTTHTSIDSLDIFRITFSVGRFKEYHSYFELKLTCYTLTNKHFIKQVDECFILFLFAFMNLLKISDWIVKYLINMGRIKSKIWKFNLHERIKRC